MINGNKASAGTTRKQVSDTPNDWHQFDNAPGFLIRCARQIAAAIFLEEMSQFGITSVQYSLMVGISKNAGADQQTLVDAVAIDRSTIGTTLSRLEKAGLVFRAAPRHNKRIKQVFLTAKGHALMDQAGEAIERVQSRILEPLEPAEQVRFMQLISKLVQGNNELSRVPLRAR